MGTCLEGCIFVQLYIMRIRMADVLSVAQNRLHTKRITKVESVLLTNQTVF